jgi:hypothetical protein
MRGYDVPVRVLEPAGKKPIATSSEVFLQFFDQRMAPPREDDRLFHLFNTVEEEIECLYFPISGIAALQHIPKTGRSVDTAFSPPGPFRYSNYRFRPALCLRHRPARPQSPRLDQHHSKSHGNPAHPRCFLSNPHWSTIFCDRSAAQIRRAKIEIVGS